MMHRNAIKLPDGRYLFDIDVQRTRLQLVAVVRELALAERWGDEVRECAIWIALSSPGYCLLPDLNAFRDCLEAARKRVGGSSR